LGVDRRRFFQLAGVTLGGGTATVLSACGNKDSKREAIQGERAVNSATDSPEGAVADVNVLNEALELEHEAVAAYSAALEVLTGSALRAGRTFRDHEREHVQALTRAIRDLGGRPTKPGRFEFPRLRTQEEVLRFAVELENGAVAAYVDAIPKLDDPDLRSTAASIVANEAEHLAVLHEAMGERAVPAAFVTGVEG